MGRLRLCAAQRPPARLARARVPLAAIEPADVVAGRHEDLQFYTTTHLEPFSSPQHALRPGLINFQPVQAGEQVSADQSPEIRVPDTGMLLFPKYPDRHDGRAIAPLPGQIFRLITPLQTHPVQLWEQD